MFRKRKVIAPAFRLPNPTNPITGQSHYLYPPLKQFTRFTLLEALDVTDEYAEAQIEHEDQWGPPPIFHQPDIYITVWNQLSAQDDVYCFSGEEGDVGLALWDYDNQWRIITMMREATGLVGGCLAENHPGRGEVFDLYLGSWSAAGNEWIYDTKNTVKAIDWRYGVPSPDAGATGLFERRKSNEHGVIYEVVALDCESPGPCGGK